MGYSNNDLDNTYESLVNLSSTDAQIWNSGTVYFDDEVVEYQGRYYKALKKTSAEVPGRSKHGIWKELVEEEDDINLDLDLAMYGEKKNTVKPIVKEKNSVEERAKKAAEIQQRSAAAKKTAPTTKKEPVQPVQAMNKPMAKKKTLKQRQEERPTIVATPTTENVQRKMQVAPSEQNLVNDVLKSINFKKIKGTNSDENEIVSNLILAQKAGDDIRLIWESSHPNIISTKGEVKRPQDGVDIAVNLSVDVTKKSISAKRFFTLWVKAEEKIYNEDESVDMVYDILDFEQICGKNERLTEITHSLELLTHGLYDTEILWASKDRNLLDERGNFYQDRLTKNTRIRIYAIIIKGNAQKLKHFELTLKVK